MWVDGAAVADVLAVGARMSELRVDPSEIHRSGVEVGNVAGTINAAFTSVDNTLASAQSRWVGHSARALASMASDWQQATRAHYQALAEHGENLTSAAKRYGQADESGARSVRSAAASIADSGPAKRGDFDLDTQFNRPQGLVGGPAGAPPPESGYECVAAATGVAMTVVQVTQTKTWWTQPGGSDGQHCK